jgi:hypothetical protein
MLMVAGAAASPVTLELAWPGLTWSGGSLQAGRQAEAHSHSGSVLFSSLLFSTLLCSART